MPVRSSDRLALLPLSLLSVALLAGCPGVAEVEVAPDTAKVAPESAAQKALGGFKPAQGLKVELVADEPLLENPVAFDIDGKGRFFVAETQRMYDGVFDTNGRWDLVEGDLACETVEDRVRYTKKKFPEWKKYERFHDRIRLLTDRDGDGVVDASVVYADGFNDIADGIGAGVLIDGDDVWYTCIPKLWRLRDKDGDGRSEQRDAVHEGFGVHISFLGHDLHGLRMGHDRRIYFSLGDRGLNVRTKEGKQLRYPHMGAVLRMERDGSQLEVFHYGLRNPQEIAFDAYGNLFSADNNSDSDDKARWVYVAEGGDTGWRTGYQFLSDRGPWNRERLWDPQFEGQAAWIVPPIAHVSKGPSGLTYNPGATRLPEAYRGNFFLADYQGSAYKSGVLAVAVEPTGAGFKVVRNETALGNLTPTDVEFGPDGALYVSDFVGGWSKPNAGRLHRLYAPGSGDDALVRQTQALLGEGFAQRGADELVKLLAHPDMRVRQGAQFALVDLAQAKGAAEVATLFAGVAQAKEGELFGRLHAVWGLGVLGRQAPEVLRHVEPLLKDADAQVRAQAAVVLGDGHQAAPADSLIAALGDKNLDVRAKAAVALGKLGLRGDKGDDAFGALIKVVRDNADKDVFVRNAAVVGLTGLAQGSEDVAAQMDARWKEVVEDESAAVRRAVVLTWRRLRKPELARYLKDTEVTIVEEAARAIYDLRIEDALPSLAGMAARQEHLEHENLWWRILNANRVLGKAQHGRALAQVSSWAQLPGSMRVEALEILAEWEKPNWQDRVVGLYRPVERDPRTASAVAASLGGHMTKLLGEAPDEVREAAAKAAARLDIRRAAGPLAALVADRAREGKARAAALLALEALGAPSLLEVAQAVGAEDPVALRQKSIKVLSKLDPEGAVPKLDSIIENAEAMGDRQAALETLGELEPAAAGEALARWLDKLRAGSLPPELQLELLEAAGKRKEASVVASLKGVEATRDPKQALTMYGECIAGGNYDRGWEVFHEAAQARCLRCHTLRGKGGNAGPELTGIGERRDREYILRALIDPGADVAEGFGEFSSMPAMGEALSRRQLRDLVEYLAKQKMPKQAG